LLGFRVKEVSRQLAVPVSQQVRVLRRQQPPPSHDRASSNIRQHSTSARQQWARRKHSGKTELSSERAAGPAVTAATAEDIQVMCNFSKCYVTLLELQ
jgi:hypothetical protein